MFEGNQICQVSMETLKSKQHNHVSIRSRINQQYNGLNATIKSNVECAKKINLDSSDLHFFFEAVEDVTRRVRGVGLAGLNANDRAREIFNPFVQVDFSAAIRI
jgi:hypothetical protein